MFSVYILQSQKDGKFYIGQTKNLTERLQRHNEGRVPSTQARTPFVVAHCESYAARSEAMRREKYLKILKGNRQLREIIGL